jgi:hypothetical protein
LHIRFVIRSALTCTIPSVAPLENSSLVCIKVSHHLLELLLRDLASRVSLPKDFFGIRPVVVSAASPSSTPSPKCETKDEEEKEDENQETEWEEEERSVESKRNEAESEPQSEKRYAPYDERCKYCKYYPTEEVPTMSSKFLAHGVFFANR